jgi:hypothetical protein
MADDDDATAAQAAKDKEAADRLTAEAAARADAARRSEEDRLRTAARDEYEKAHEALWAQATDVVNVKALIPNVLDKATDTYTKWRGMFLTVLGKYALTQRRRQRGGRRGLQPPYCLRNKGILLQFSLKFSAINECLRVEEDVHTLAYTTIESSFTFL